MKKIIAIALALVMLLALVGCGGGDSSTPSDNKQNTSSDNQQTPATDDKVYTIEIDYPNPESSVGFRALTAWADMLKEQSNGRLNIKIYSGGALGALPDCVNNCVSGVTDSFWSGVTIYPGVFPLTEVFGLPLISASYEAQNLAMKDMLANYAPMASEWEDLYVVACHGSAGSPILFSKEIDSIQEMAGMKLRISNAYTTTWFESKGVSPVSCGINDGYENISKGVIDGGLFYFDKVESSALYEVIDSIYVGQSIGALNMLCLNRDVYEALPADLQELIDNSGDFFVQQSIDGFNQQQEDMIKVCEEHGVKVIYETEESYAWLADGVEAVWADWAATMEAQGLPGQECLDMAIELIAKYSE